MNIHLYKKAKVILVIAILFISSCKKFVDPELPKTLLYAGNTFNSDNTATAALTAIYAQTENDIIPYNIPLFTGLSGDELKNYSSSQPITELFTNNIQTNNSSVQNTWTAFYKYIYEANLVIEGLQSSTGVSDAVKKQLSGEAMFIRAFSLFNLANLYGDVPVVTSSDYSTNRLTGRNSVSDIYDQIISDLKAAQGLLNSNYVAADGVATVSARIRPNKATASALLARTYLYKGDWANAELQASDVISNALHDTVPLNSVFLNTSKEAIWQLQPVVTGYNTPEGRYFILAGPPSPSGTNSCTSLSSQLLGSFEAGDKRRTSWVYDTTISSIAYSMPYKYKVRLGLGSSEYSMVLRLGEIYLIRAEARAQQNTLTGALTDLNVIRKRAGLSNVNLSSQAAVLDAIYHERQVELFTEWGHRWYDLKRTGRVDAVMNSYAPVKGVTWQTNKKLYPIPQTERDRDPNLSQNPNY